MRQVKTETLLRTIVLDYDESRTESDYEKELLKAYVDIHDKIAALKNRRGKLAYEYGLHEDQIEQGEKALAPVAAGIKGFLQEVEVIAEKIKSDEAMTNVNVRMTEFHEEFIDPFQQAHIEPVAETCKALHEEYKAYDDAVENLREEFHQYHNGACESLYNNYDNYALDLCAYDDDEQELRRELDKLWFNEEHAKIINRYNALMAATRAAYAGWEEVKRKMSEYYDDSGLLDNSLSVSCAQNKIEKDKQPIYLIPPGDKRIEDFKLNYGLLANRNTHTVTMNIPVEAVNKSDVFMLQEIIMLLQHYPKMIEKWIFSIEIVFLNRDEIEMQEDDWKGMHPPMRWFNKLNSMPAAIFFIQDSDARAYMLMGDLLADGKLVGEMHNDEQAVKVEGEMLQEVQNRLFTSCMFFLLYAHNTGFDPQPYIEALMSEFDAMFTYEDVVKDYEGKIKDNIQLRAVPLKDGKEQWD
jgi:hypothetical protein